MQVNGHSGIEGTILYKLSSYSLQNADLGASAAWKWERPEQESVCIPPPTFQRCSCIEHHFGLFLSGLTSYRRLVCIRERVYKMMMMM